MKKITPVFGNQGLFDDTPDDVTHITTGGGWYKIKDKIVVCVSDESISFDMPGRLIAERRIEETPEPKRWTVADQKAGRLPDIGYKFEFTREQEKALAYLNGKEGWESGDILEVIHTCVDQDGDLWAIVINTDPEVLSTARLRIDFFTPEETPDEKAIRLEGEFVRSFLSNDLNYERGLRDAYRKLSGDLPPVQAKAST